MTYISFIMITARDDHPYLGRPELHLFEPTIETFRNQSMKDFELVIIDVLYENRKDYFKNKNLPFPVKHVPAKPNHWLEKGFPGICSQYNKGIIYSDGELLFFTGDSHMVMPDFMENLWSRYNEGYFPMAWYFFDNSFATPNLNPARGDMDSLIKKEKWAEIAYPERTKSPIPYSLCGYSGNNVSIEHRYVQAFKGNSNTIYPSPWLWWFGCSSASLEAMLKINGFDEKFDGDRMLLDCDVGSRLDLAGYRVRFALFRDIFLIRASTDMGNWNQELQKDATTIKCNYPLIWYSRFFNKYKANSYILSEKDIDWIKNVFCSEHCPIRELCKKEHPWQYPFEHKSGYSGHHSSQQWFNYWQEHQVIRDLTLEREKRLSGNKQYEVGTFI